MKVVKREAMLAASPLRSERDEREREMKGFDESFGGGNLLDSIDFDDIFAGIDVLPDLEIDCEALAEFSGSEMESSENNSANAPPDSVSVSDVSLESPARRVLLKTEESEPEPERGPLSESEPEPEPEPAAKSPASKEDERSRKNPPAKKKAKVDWTPELHRRFVAAVDQLGIDKAVPSRILEIMGIDCLTRHNIASHLQKYRSHRKHLLAREAEAASWSRRRQTYGTAAAQAEVNPWIAPTMGFPPVAPLPHFRPLHVWGHPSVDQSLMYTWPKHAAPPLADPSFWHRHHHHQYIPPPGTLSFPPHRFSQPPAAAVPQAPSDVHPSKESIDAAIGDVLKKPWLPLPLGLKPPSINGVMVELQRQAYRKYLQLSYC